MIHHQPTLSADQAEAVLALAGRAQAADLTSPLNDAARLAVAGRGSADVVHWLDQQDDQLIGYAQLDRRDGSVQLMVDPAHRRAGHGRALADQVLGSGLARSWWAFGDLPGARELAQSLHLLVIRKLLIMTLELSDQPDAAPVPPPAGITIDHFRATDLPRLVSVNAAAFADHPEQGALTADDFSARMAQDWYHDEDLLVARDASGLLVGYHWTKLEHLATGVVGEVYVLGVDPSQAGRGSGRALLAAGIIQMQSQGASAIKLYVEAANERVVTMYRTAGFEITHIDVAYGSVQED